MRQHHGHYFMGEMHRAGLELLARVHASSGDAASSPAPALPQPAAAHVQPPVCPFEVSRLLDLFVTYDGLVPAREFANDVWNIMDLCERQMIFKSPYVQDCGGYLLGEGLRKHVQRV